MEVVPALRYVLLVRNAHKLSISEKFRKRFSFIYGRCCCCRDARICASGDFPYADPLLGVDVISEFQGFEGVEE